MPPLVSTQWLSDHLADPGLVVVDASWHLPGSGRDGHAEYLQGHIPGAVFFDIDAIADAQSALPHMLPAPERFAELVGALGIGSDDTIVVYDEHGLFSAARAFWSLRVMGARDVRLLEGGGPKWRAENHPLESGEKHKPPAAFHPRFDAEAVADFAATRAAVETGSAQILDARPAARFSGASPEPRPRLRAGHIPGSANLPFSELVQDGSLKPAEELKSLFAAAGIETGRPVITSCGSGVSAALAALALEAVGADKIVVYDGSWAEWGAREDAPVETGQATARGSGEPT